MTSPPTLSLKSDDIPTFECVIMSFFAIFLIFIFNKWVKPQIFISKREEKEIVIITNELNDLESTAKEELL